MNFHGGPEGAYAAIAFNSSGALQVRPLFYGLHLFTQLVANHSSWRAANVSALPPNPGPIPGPSADPYCAAGIRGDGGVCCAAQCGVCGGAGCDQLPGGAANCCGHTIATRNASCDSHRAPCVVDGALPPPTSALVAFAASSRGGAAGATKVLLVAKTAVGFPDAAPVAVCSAAPSILGAVGARGELWLLAGSAGGRDERDARHDYTRRAHAGKLHDGRVEGPRAAARAALARRRCGRGSVLRRRAAAVRRRDAGRAPPGEYARYP